MSVERGHHGSPRLEDVAATLAELRGCHYFPKVMREHFAAKDPFAELAERHRYILDMDRRLHEWLELTGETYLH